MSSDARDLARFFQDWAGLWQEEILAQANDPAAQEAWQVMAAAWANTAGAAFHDLTSPMDTPRDPAATRNAGPRDAGSTAGAPAASAASDPLDGTIERLIGRIDALEARIAALEPIAVRPDRGRG